MDSAQKARDAIWTFRQSPDAVTLLELMRSAELDVVPLTHRHSNLELVLACKPLRLVLRQWETTSVISRVVESRESLDTWLTETAALEFARQLRSSTLWRTVRLHVESHTLEQQRQQDQKQD